eukprot:Nk52_evm71s485 gene=Nk52_evmTU71s485
MAERFSDSAAPGAMFEGNNGEEAKGKGVANGSEQPKQRLSSADEADVASSAGDSTAVSKSGSYLMIRLLLLSKEVGCVIGKGGSVVKAFREQTNTRINISESQQGTFERIVVVSGPVENIILAICKIVDKLQEDYFVHRWHRKNSNTSGAGNIQTKDSDALSANAPGLNAKKDGGKDNELGENMVGGKKSSVVLPAAEDGAGSEANVAPALNALRKLVPFEESVHSGMVISLKLLVPHSQAGCLIGKGGAKIKEIREISGTQISVSQDMLPNSTERAVILTGTAGSITTAVALICDVLHENPMKGSTILYKPHMRAPHLYDYRFNSGNHPNSGMHNPHHVQQSFGGNMPFGSFPSPIQGHQHSLPVQYHPGHPQVQPGMHMNAHVLSVGQAAQQMMSIPNEMVGCIIGKGGARINEIRSLSGATVKVLDFKPGAAERMISITGTPEQNQMACYLLNSRIKFEMNKGSQIS